MQSQCIGLLWYSYTHYSVSLHPWINALQKKLLKLIISRRGSFTSLEMAYKLYSYQKSDASFETFILDVQFSTVGPRDKPRTTEVRRQCASRVETVRPDSRIVFTFTALQFFRWYGPSRIIFRLKFGYTIFGCDSARIGVNDMMVNDSEMCVRWKDIFFHTLIIIC